MISSRGRVKSAPAAAARSCRRHASPPPAPPGGAGGGAGPVITSANNATINIDGSGRDTLPGCLPPHSPQLLHILVTAPACIRTLETCSPRTICGVDLSCVKFVTNYSQRSTRRPSMLCYCSRGGDGMGIHHTPHLAIIDTRWSRHGTAIRTGIKPISFIIYSSEKCHHFTLLPSDFQSESISIINCWSVTEQIVVRIYRDQSRYSV